MNFLKKAQEAALKAGEILKRHFQKNSKEIVSFKTKHEITTKADFLSEKIILTHLKKNFPSHCFLSEEKGINHRKSNYLWVIDPLDGTTNFSYRNPMFAISIALSFKEKLILGIVYAPLLKETFWGEINKGAFLNGKKIKVSKIANLRKSLLTFCHGHKLEDIKRAIKIYQQLKLKAFDLRQIGSASLELSYVACGRTEAIIIPGAHPWDVAAGSLIVREALGKVTDFKGKEWSLKSRDILASNKNINKKLLNFLKDFKK